jgi:hypothetical protein
MVTKTKLTRFQKEVLFGILLGDGSLQWNERKTKCRLRFTQKNESYCFHVYTIFRNFVATPPKQNKKTGVWYWNTVQCEQFRFYRQQFYAADGKKKIPKLIHRWLTPRTIAYWYMDDGSIKEKKKSTAVRFCTDCFSYQDIQRIGRAFERVYQLKTSIVAQGSFRRIGIAGGENGKRFGHLVAPYIFPSMNYKIPPRWDFN